MGGKGEGGGGESRRPVAAKQEGSGGKEERKLSPFWMPKTSFRNPKNDETEHGRYSHRYFSTAVASAVGANRRTAEEPTKHTISPAAPSQSIINRYIY